MNQTPPQTGPLIAGGVLLGAWIFFGLLPLGGDPAWTSGGVFGLLVALGAYSLRYAAPAARTGLAVAVGIVAGLGAMLILATEQWMMLLSFLWATVACTVIVGGLPRPVDAPRFVGRVEIRKEGNGPPGPE